MHALQNQRKINNPVPFPFTLFSILRFGLFRASRDIKRSVSSVSRRHRLPHLHDPLHPVSRCCSLQLSLLRHSIPAAIPTALPITDTRKITQPAPQIRRNVCYAAANIQSLPNNRRLHCNHPRHWHPRTPSVSARLRHQSVLTNIHFQPFRPIGRRNRNSRASPTRPHRR